LDDEPVVNDSPTDPLIVVRSDYGLPYSKGLMAQSMMGAGLPPERSHALARRIESILHARGESEVDVEDLRELAEEVLAEEEGEQVVRRFGQWWRVRSLPRPLVVLLSGVTGVGKSTIATNLAGRLGITRLVATDQIRQIVRAFFSHDFLPAVHHSSFDVANQLFPDGNEDESATIAGFLRQVHDLAPGIDALVERSIDEHVPIIVEGVHLLPDIPEPSICDRGITARALLVVADEDEHRAHLHARGAQTPRSADRYLEGFDRIRALQDYLLAHSREAGMPVVDASALEPALKQVTEIVLDAVGAAEEGFRAEPESGGNGSRDGSS
jgi:2-phosphoglycerate kinase